jgi:hypothetical protein
MNSDQSMTPLDAFHAWSTARAAIRGCKDLKL